MSTHDSGEELHDKDLVLERILFVWSLAQVRSSLAYHIDEPSRTAFRRTSGDRARALERGSWVALQDHLPDVFVSNCQPVLEVRRKDETYSMSLFVQSLEHLCTLSRTRISDI